MAFSVSLEQELNRWNNAIRSYPNDPKVYIQRGMVNFKLALISESIQDFARAEKLNPALSPYLWQRGLSFYYAERFGDGAKQFELDLSVNAQDVEETIWRYLCIARLQGVIEARKEMLVVNNDPRLVMQRVYDLYAGSCTTNDVLVAGQSEGTRGRFYSHLYVGLYYEAAGDWERAQEYVVKAASEYKLDDYMWSLANVHQKLRGWNPKTTQYQ